MPAKDIDFFYRKHIRAARKAAKGLSGLDRAEAIYIYFEYETQHPHARYTYDQEMMNRNSDHQFPIDLMKVMSSLSATNDWLDLDSKTNTSD
ncbi:hypothetical protein [Vibrio crassostreae]|uniref:hypothetical protein n=1 Tax=Vibrio crassostreae TaxID=246167 RepID=UPI001B306740|nr:hypothetical protein [Vibrio crassostreae]